MAGAGGDLDVSEFLESTWGADGSGWECGGWAGGRRRESGNQDNYVK